MNQKDIIKYAALAAAAYFLYKYLRDNGYLAELEQLLGGGDRRLLPPPGEAPGPAATTAPPPASGPPAVVAPTAASIRELVKSHGEAVMRGMDGHLAGSVVVGTCDEWNVFWKDATGREGPDPGLIGCQSGVKVPFEIWWNGMSAAGLLAGLGIWGDRRERGVRGIQIGGSPWGQQASLRGWMVQ